MADYRPRDCPCLRFERPLCHPHCWHFGFNKDICKHCGEGYRIPVEAPSQSDKVEKGG